MNLLLDFDGRRLQGARPFAVFEAKNDCWSFSAHGEQKIHSSGSGGVLRALRKALEWSRENRSTHGAAVGFFSYDFARAQEPRAFGKHSPPDELHLPDVRLAFFEEFTCVEENAPTPISSSGQTRSQEYSATQKVCAEYSSAIAQIQNYIAAGDIYQANYAQRFSAALPCSPAQLYERLRSTHAAPFGALLEWDDFAIVSNSPERFLKLEHGVLTAQPIKGTAPRGSTPEEDARIRRELEISEKNRAENVMIVDLLRNDFGRVCEYGTIAVPQLFEIQSFPTLHHLVSTVTGVLRADCDALDAFAAAFPCGSITGAPKIRAMQIINELENTRRGASFGAIGYFGFGADSVDSMEWNVAIRTVTCKDGIAVFHAGGGIVADSEAADEYSEMRLKTKALLAALQSAPECAA